MLSFNNEYFKTFLRRSRQLSLFLAEFLFLSRMHPLSQFYNGGLYICTFLEIRYQRRQVIYHLSFDRLMLITLGSPANRLLITP
jgi:hypothetical protein